METVSNIIPSVLDWKHQSSRPQFRFRQGTTVRVFLNVLLVCAPAMVERTRPECLSSFFVNLIVLRFERGAKWREDCA